MTSTKREKNRKSGEKKKKSRKGARLYAYQPNGPIDLNTRDFKIYRGEKGKVGKRTLQKKTRTK